MTSEARVLANRRNSSKSTGPRTTEGKAVVARNALKHGFLAHQDLIPGEDREQFESCRRLLLEDLAPLGPMESTLAERIVSCSWRLKRADRLQNEVFDYLIAEEITDSLSHYGDELSDADQQAIVSKPDTDPHLAVGRAVYKDYTHGEMALDRLMMYERRIENSLYRTMNELYKLRRLREQDGGHRTACETKPMEAAGAVCSVPASACPEPAEGASREETPCGVTTNGDECAKQSQFVTAEGGQRPPYKTAKQSQSQEVSSRAGSVPQDEPSCETKPIEAAEAVCTVPARASREETPCGVTTNGDGDAKQSQSVTVEAGHSLPSETAKQSQCRQPAAGVRGLLRARPRVAYHYHNVAGSC